MKIWLSGAAGHMGRAIASLAEERGITVIAGLDRVDAGCAFPVCSSPADLPEGGDALIDFSAPAVLDDLLPVLVERGIPAVLATTGYTDAQLRAIDEAAAHIAIFRSANMSVGIALLRRLCAEAARALGPEYDIEIVEAHHHRKKDAPSGTALMLSESIRSAREQASEVFGRHGRDCRRNPGEIGIHAIRGGTVTGEHQVMFLGDQERIVLSHSAENRSVFASGALQAAAFLIGKAPGLYDMNDLIGEAIPSD
ncbi:MAG: 4-hydroxy-tetrahydrodipicolinate reductase [Clostridia bacterium]|nr:4-hydroxy-tetrahydrodipicolinate reductase [Clostridia bacterium]